MPKRTTIRTPSGLQQVIEHEREVELTDPHDPLSLDRVVDRVTINGRTSMRTFEVATRTQTTMSPEGRTKVVVLDDHERVIETRVPGLEPIYQEYDERGRPFRQTQGTRVSSLAYDAAGFLASTTDALLRTETLDHDAVGRITIHRDAEQRETHFGHDANGNTTSIQPPDRPPYLSTYDGMDREETFAAPQIGGEIFLSTRSFDLDGDQTRAVLADGRTIDFVYDAQTGELTEVIAPDGITAYAYDPASKAISVVTSPDGVTVSYARDGSLITSIEYSGEIEGEITHTFDSDFRLASDAVAGTGVVTYGYDLDGLLVEAGALELTYRADNGLPETTTLDSISDLRAFDGYADETSYVASRGASELYAAAYVRDSLGRIAEKTEAIGATTHHFIYHYDTGDRLEQVDRDGVVVERYTYDANDNRLSAESPAGVIAATYDEQDRLTSFGDLVFTYNATGPVATKVDTVTNDTTIYDYDVRGNLKEVSLPDGRAIQYVVDGWNRRVAKRIDGQADRGFLWDGDQLVAELDAAGSVRSRFVYATRSHAPDYLIRGGVTYRIIADQLGSPRLVVDTQTGAIAQRIDYDSFGRVTLDTQPGFQPFGFAGGLYDPDTKLVRFGARDYDAELGRWTAKDPSGFEDSTNAYLYVGNDPVNRIDPTGRWGFLATLGVGALVDALIDVAMQLLENGGRFGCIDWGRVAKQVALGAAANLLGIGLCKKLGKLGCLLGLVASFFLSFDADTLVTTIDGPRAIQDIRAGDLALAMDDETGDVGWKPVTHVFVTPDRPLIALEIEAQNAGAEILEVTSEHPLWTEQRGWTNAGRLEIGERILADGGIWLSVLGSTSLPGVQPVYNLEVADYHSYFVGADGAWAHNCKNPWGRRGSPAHRQMILAAEKRLAANGWKLVAGGSAQEAKFGSRFPDLVMRRGSEKIAVQVGKATKGGKPVAREVRAIDDLRAWVGPLGDSFKHVFFLKY